MREAVSDAAWIQAMLDVEAALARAQAKLKVIPDRAARDIVPHCRVEKFDIKQIGLEAAHSANPVVPLVKALREKVGSDMAQYVHRGATSQDILDTAMMLIARRGIDVMLEDLRAAAGAAAMLADRHRSAVMAGRTLLQQASVTTFGLKAAGWLMAIMETRNALFVFSKHHLAVQLGGAVGTMAALQEGTRVARELSIDLDLGRTTLPWHTDRRVIAELGTQLAIACGVAGKIALDVVLLAQTEVDEVREHRAAGRGRSSAMPQKRNPVEAVEILAAVRTANAQAGILLGSMLQEHERAAGAWQSEWLALTEVFLAAGGATFRLASLLGSLEVVPKRMRKNLDTDGGLVMSEQLLMALADRTDFMSARALVEQAVSKVMESGRPLREVAREIPGIAENLTEDELRKALDPANDLGSSAALIDRALVDFRARDWTRGK